MVDVEYYLFVFLRDWLLFVILCFFSRVNMVSVGVVNISENVRDVFVFIELVMVSFVVRFES